MKINLHRTRCKKCCIGFYHFPSEAWQKNQQVRCPNCWNVRDQYEDKKEKE